MNYQTLENVMEAFDSTRKRGNLFLLRLRQTLEKRKKQKVENMQKN